MSLFVRSAKRVSNVRFASTKGTSIFASLATSASAPFTVTPLTLRPIRANEIRVRVIASGLCHTDVAVKERGLVQFPIVLGHEGSGVVEEIGSTVTEVKPGDHVIMSYASCGTCKHCNRGKPAYCLDHGSLNFAGTHADGSLTHSGGGHDKIFGSFFQQSSFASHVVCGTGNVVKVDKKLDLNALAPLGCGIQTGAGAVMNTFAAPVNSTLVVFGAGAVGLSAVLAARINRLHTIVVVDINEARLNLATEFGATHVIKVTGKEEKGTVSKQLLSILLGGFDFALDTSGSKIVLAEAFKSLGTLGVAGLVAGSAPGTEVGIEMLPLLNGRQVRGIIQGDAISKNFLPILIDLYSKGLFPFDRMITYYNGLEELNRAIAESKDVGFNVIKPVIKVGKL